MSESIEDIDFQEDPAAMAKARAILKAKGFNQTPKARKQKEAKICSAVDRRTLKVTGRTEQFNFRAREGLKAQVAEASAQEGIAMAAWLERAIEEALGKGK